MKNPKPAAKTFQRKQSHSAAKVRLLPKSVLGLAIALPVWFILDFAAPQINKLLEQAQKIRVFAKASDFVARGFESYKNTLSVLEENPKCRPWIPWIAFASVAPLASALEGIKGVGFMTLSPAEGLAVWALSNVILVVAVEKMWVSLRPCMHKSQKLKWLDAKICQLHHLFTQNEYVKALRTVAAAVVHDAKCVVKTWTKSVQQKMHEGWHGLCRTCGIMPSLGCASEYRPGESLEQAYPHLVQMTQAKWDAARQLAKRAAQLPVTWADELRAAKAGPLQADLWRMQRANRPVRGHYPPKRACQL